MADTRRVTPRGRSETRDRRRGREEGIGRTQDRVAGADLQRAEGQPQGVRAGVAGDRVPRFAVFGQLGLEGLHRFAEDELARGHDFGKALE